MQNMGGKQGVLWEMGKLGIEFCPLTYAAFFKMDIINYQLIFVTSEANKQNTSAGMKTLVYSENGQDGSINKSEIARIKIFSFSLLSPVLPIITINTIIIIREKKPDALNARSYFAALTKASQRSLKQTKLIKTQTKLIIITEP